MKIIQIETIPFKLPYKSFLQWGLAGYLEAAEHVLVRVHTDGGVIGVAEATPRPTIYGESQASIMHAIRDWFAPMIEGMDPCHTEKIWAKLETIHLDSRFHGNDERSGAVVLGRGRIHGVHINGLKIRRVEWYIYSELT